MAQRISRAKRMIKASGMRFEMPPEGERADRPRACQSGTRRAEARRPQPGPLAPHQFLIVVGFLLLYGLLQNRGSARLSSWFMIGWED
jgi:hypothetical protein